jgi:flagellar protein FliL
MAENNEATGKTDKKAKKAKKGKSPLVLVILLLVGVVGGMAVSKMVLGGSAEAGTEAEPPPEPGEVAAIDAININLADGHFLRIGVGAQLTKEVTVKPEAWAETEGTKVRDAIIEVFSGRDMTELSTAEGRKAAVHELTELAMERTEKQVMGIYLSEFVMQ